MYNHTLKGGLRAGNFSMLASVDDIEVCAALCCEEKYCDLGKNIMFILFLFYSGISIDKKTSFRDVRFIPYPSYYMSVLERF